MMPLAAVLSRDRWERSASGFGSLSTGSEEGFQPLPLVAAQKRVSSTVGLDDPA
jgi:hypothetical protein